MVRSLFGPMRRSYLDISHIQLGSDEVEALCTRVDPPDPPRCHETGSATVAVYHNVLNAYCIEWEAGVTLKLENFRSHPNDWYWYYV